MKIYDKKSQFGWENDNGLGLKLIQQIMSSQKRATAAPKSLYSEKEIRELYDSEGQPATVIDKEQKPHCNILITHVFETKFGSPDDQLIKGEGCSNAEEFKQSHREAWSDLVQEGKLKLTDETVLLVEIFKLLSD